MAQNITPTNEELRMEEGDLIVSKTDTKGRITYCNEIFLRFSGYDEAELLDQPHSIIRHPDMPRSVFRFLWQTIQKQQEFFGIIKNMNKSGAYYWTFANVTPSFNEHGDVIGYYSVRRQPSREIIAIMTPIYQAMCAEEARHNSSQQAMDASFKILQDAISEYHQPYTEFIYTHA